jgi:hypothetical protein
MERSDERLSTRDIASPTTSSDDAGRVERDDARFERDDAGGGHAVTGDTMATMADPAGAAADREPERDLREPGGERAAAGTTGTTGTTADDSRRTATPLLADSEGFQARWEEIQVRFVDEPRGAVEDADALVATVMQRLAESFAQEREGLEAQWGRGEDISTEDLRVALQRYRSFFQRLLAT